MKERRSAIGRATELAGSVVAGVKRRQQARAPKVLLYDDQSRPRTIEPGSEHAQALIETAQQLVLIAGPPEELGPDPLDPPVA
jgi:hypothetical protein